MPFDKNSRRRAEIGAIAPRLLTIPVMAAALLVAYFTLRSQTADQPAVMADISTQYIATPEEAGLPPAAGSRSARAEPYTADSAVAEHEALDPVGAGRPLP